MHAYEKQNFVIINLMKQANKEPGQRPKLPSRFLLALFAVAALALVPWAVWLSLALPAGHLDRRWNVAWSGFDFGMVSAFCLTAYWGWRKSGWVVVAAAAAGTFLLVDAWFDCLTAAQGNEYLLSIALAICAELPLSVLAFWIAYRAGRHYFGTAAARPRTKST